MADMIKFYKGLEASLPASGANGALYITTDEGGIYLGTGAGMKRLGDFVQVANVAALPAKAHENCLYYCVAENILAKWNGTEWKQVNKQPTTEELKTLLGLGSMAYTSEVAEDNLSAALKEKVNAAAEGNHSHANKTVLDGITAEKVTAWDAAEGNAKTYADGLNTAMDTRVKAVEATSHTHSNKALLDTYTQTEENLADAVAKKHEHSNKTELDKIVAGDKAKWDAVVADHLTSTDKTALEDSIGDVNTALGEEVTRAKGAEKANADAIAAIKDGASVDSFADVEAELAKKVDKVEGKSLVSDAEIARLAAMSDGANKVEASETNGNIKIDGVETVVYTHPAKHAIADVDGLQAALDGKQAAGDYAAEVHTHTKSEITDFAHTHTVSEITDFDEKVRAYDYATKAEAQGYADAKDEAIEAAQAAADKAQEEVDALETYVGTIPSDEKYADITNVIAYVNKKAEETLASAQGGSSETAASVKAALDTYKAENDPKVQANTDAIAAINNEETGILAQAKAHADSKDDDIAAALSEAQAKVASVTAGDASVTVGGAATAPTVAAKLSADADNALTLAEDGLKVVIPAAAEYSIVKAADSGEYAAVYNLTKDGTIVGASINIPKDMVVKSGSVVGDEIVLVLNDEAGTEIKIPVASLIEYVTSGSQTGDMVVINVSDDHKVTATITDGTITLAKLTTEVQTAIGKAHSHENAGVLDGITADKVAAWDAAEDNAIAKANELNGAMDTRVKALEAIDHEAYKAYADQAEADANDYTDAEVAKDRERLDTLEAIDYDAYVAADAALKTELQAEIDADVKALADGAVATNTADIAEIMEMLTWGSFGD